MKLSAPTQLFFIIALVVTILGILGKLGVVAAIAPYAFWFAVAGWAVLAVGSLMKGV